MKETYCRSLKCSNGLLFVLALSWYERVLALCSAQCILLSYTLKQKAPVLCDGRAQGNKAECSFEVYHTRRLSPSPTSPCFKDHKYNQAALVWQVQL